MTQRQTGEPTNYPQVAGVIRCAVADGAGGFFVGGRFTAVGGLERHNLAHILSDGSVAAWCPNADDEVLAMALGRGELYVSGAFHQIGSAQRDLLAGVDPKTGMATPWRPEPDDIVRTLCASGRKLFIGGDFTTLGGLAHPRLAAFEQDSLIAEWAPAVNGRVTCIVVRDTLIILGGTFTSVNDQPRNWLGAVTLASGALSPWDPQLSRAAPLAQDEGPGVDALLVNDSTVICGGAFDHVGLVQRTSLCVIGVRTGLATAWDAKLEGVGEVFPARVKGLALVENQLCVAGRYGAIGGQPNDGNGGLVFSYANAVDVRTGLIQDWNPRPDGPVWTLAVSDGARMVAMGGDFHSVWNWRPQPFLASFDARTGEPTPWMPSPDGFVRSLALHGDLVYVAGRFSHIGGQARAGLAALDHDANATPWNPESDGPVRAITIGRDGVYLGGGFQMMDGQLRRYLCSVDTVFGAVTSWNPSVDDWVFDIAIHDSTVYAAGLFTTAEGKQRIGLAAFDGASGSVRAWDPRCNNFVNAISLRDSVVYVGGYFDSLGAERHVRCGAVSTLTGRALPWYGDTESESPSENYVQSILATDSVVYVGGGFTSVGNHRHLHLAALSRASGEVASWAPDPDGFAWTIATSGSVLYVGGAFDAIDGAPAGSVAEIPGLGSDPRPPMAPTAPRVAQVTPSPTSGLARIRFSVPHPGEIQLVLYDLQGRQSKIVKDTFQCAEGENEIVVDTTQLRAGYYACRLLYRGAATVGRLIVVK